MTMTDAEWLTSSNPKELLSTLLPRASGESLRSLACHCCRRIFERYTADWADRVFQRETGYSGGYVGPSQWRPDVLLAAIDAAEGFIEKRVTAEQLQSAEQSARAVSTEQGFASASYRLGDSATGAEYEVGYVGWKCSDAVAFCCAQDIRGSVTACLSNAAESLSSGWIDFPNDYSVAAERRVQATLIRDIFGNPFRPVTFSPAWRTDAVLTLARQMYDSRDFSAMPILADALQDAGCDNEDILNHCRSDGPHVRGCWVADLVLGKG
jgi:hypothetical protein